MKFLCAVARSHSVSPSAHTRKTPLLVFNASLVLISLLAYKLFPSRLFKKLTIRALFSVLSQSKALAHLTNFTQEWKISFMEKNEWLLMERMGWGKNFSAFIDSKLYCNLVGFKMLIAGYWLS